MNRRTFISSFCGVAVTSISGYTILRDKSHKIALAEGSNIETPADFSVLEDHDITIPVGPFTIQTDELNDSDITVEVQLIKHSNSFGDFISQDKKIKTVNSEDKITKFDEFKLSFKGEDLEFAEENEVNLQIHLRIKSDDTQQIVTSDSFTISKLTGETSNLEKLVMTEEQREACDLVYTNEDMRSRFTSGDDYVTVGSHAARNSSGGSIDDGEKADFIWENRMNFSNVEELEIDIARVSNAFRLKIEFYINGDFIGDHEPDFGDSGTVEKEIYSVPKKHRYENSTFKIRIEKVTGTWPGSVGIDNIRPEIFQSEGANL